MSETALRPHEVLLKGWKCLRCGWEWAPRRGFSDPKFEQGHKSEHDRNEEPELCAKCRSPYWSKPRKAK